MDDETYRFTDSRPFVRRLRFCTAGHFRLRQSLTLLCMEAQDSPDTMHSRVHQVLERFPAADPVILMTDIPVGSTTQIAIPFLEDYANLYIVTGLNLGLLLEVALNPMRTMSARSCGKRLKPVAKHYCSSMTSWTAMRNKKEREMFP